MIVSWAYHMMVLAAGAVSQLLAAAPTMSGSSCHLAMQLLLAMAGSDCCSHRFQGPQVVVQVLHIIQTSGRSSAGGSEAVQARADRRTSCAGGACSEAAELVEQEEQQQQQQQQR